MIPCVLLAANRISGRVILTNQFPSAWNNITWSTSHDCHNRYRYQFQFLWKAVPCFRWTPCFRADYFKVFSYLLLYV